MLIDDDGNLISFLLTQLNTIGLEITSTLGSYSVLYIKYQVVSLKSISVVLYNVLFVFLIK